MPIQSRHAARISTAHRGRRAATSCGSRAPLNSSVRRRWLGIAAAILVLSYERAFFAEEPNNVDLPATVTQTGCIEMGERLVFRFSITNSGTEALRYTSHREGRLLLEYERREGDAWVFDDTNFIDAGDPPGHFVLAPGSSIEISVPTTRSVSRRAVATFRDPKDREVRVYSPGTTSCQRKTPPKKPKSSVGA